MMKWRNKSSSTGWIGNPLGFTLLELMVVLLVIGLVLTITFPKFQEFTGGNIKSVSRKLIGTIQYLYEEALANRRIYRLNYDLTQQQYWASALRESTESTREEVPVLPKTALPTGVMLEDVVVLHEGKVNRGETFTEFYPIGGVEKSIIHLRGDRGEMLTLEINPLTGRVRVDEGYRDFDER